MLNKNKLNSILCILSLSVLLISCFDGGGGDDDNINNINSVNNTNNTGGGNTAIGCCRTSVPSSSNFGITYQGPVDDIEVIERQCSGTYLSWSNSACPASGSYGSCTATADGIISTIEYYDQTQASFAESACTGTWD